MINKKFIFITLIFALIISLTAISATDISNNDTTITTADQTSPDNNIQTKNTPQTTKTINKNTQSNTKEASNTTVTSYTQLYETLTSPTADEDTTVNLDGEEKYTITNTINVSNAIKNLVINGNGKTIDGNNTTGFLFINHTCNLIINNITLENCKTTDHDDDSITGAIFLRYGNVLINNTKMNNNNGTIGSAINIQPYTNPADIDDNTEHVYNVTIQNSEFNDNKALLSGGAIAYVGIKGSNFTIENCTFNKNINNDTDASVLGGAVYISSKGKVLINNSEFNSNIGQLGGALFIDNNGTSTITNTKFRSNNGMSGGAIRALNAGNLTLENTELSNNNASMGGAVNIDNTGNVDVNNLTFTSNEGAYGSAIAGVIEGTLKINNTSFINNTGNLGATYIISTSNITIENSRYDSNKAHDTEESTAGAGAINLITSGNTTINNVNFTSNYGDDAGAIDYLGHNSSNLEISNSNFNRNGMDREIYGGSYTGGAMAIVTLGNVTLDNNNYTLNFAQNGGAIYYINPTPDKLEQNISENSKLIINNSKFNTHGYNPMSGACYYGGAVSIESNNTVIIDNSEFVENMGMELGGAVYYIGHDESSLLVNNTKFDTNGHLSYEYTENGGALYVNTTGNTTITNTEFLNNHADSYYYWQTGGTGEGGALYYNNQNSNTTLTISNVTFDSNGRKKQFDYTTADGGAAYINTTGNISITDSKFINNSAQTAGAVHIIQTDNNSSILIENTLFDSNGFGYHYASTDEGGAITAQTLGNISIVNSSFANNIAREGGAISLIYNNLEIINSNFDNNGIRELEDEECGGAAYLSANGNTIITNSNFTNKCDKQFSFPL